MERACQENVAFRVITGNRQPYFTTINEFRRVHRKHFETLFVEVLKLRREAGLVKLRHVAADGAEDARHGEGVGETSCRRSSSGGRAG